MNILLRALISVCFSILLCPLYVSAIELSKGGKDTISIGQLKVQPSVAEIAEKKNQSPALKLLVNSLETQFVSALNATRVFELVERNRKDDIELEQAYAAESVDPNDNNAAQADKMAGARFVFLPQIDGFEDKSNVTEYREIGRASLSRKMFVSAIVQIVDTTTGKLLAESPSLQLAKTEELENVRIGQLSGSNEFVVALAKEMAQKLSWEVIAHLRPAKVLAVTNKQVEFDRGNEAGFNKGDLVDIFTVQNVKDEDTGEVYRNEVPVGQAVITRIDKYQSYARITGDDLGITKGCVVRFAKSAVSRASEGAPPQDVTLPDFGTKVDPGNTPGSSEKPLKWK